MICSPDIFDLSDSSLNLFRDVLVLFLENLFPILHFQLWLLHFFVNFQILHIRYSHLRCSSVICWLSNVCLKRKNILVFFEWNVQCFFGGFRILQISHRFRLSFILINFARNFFFRTGFPPFVSSLQSNIRLKSSQKTICLLEISISSSIFCKIEKAIRVINIDYYKIVLIYFSFLLRFVHFHRFFDQLNRKNFFQKIRCSTVRICFTVWEKKRTIINSSFHCFLSFNEEFASRSNMKSLKFTFCLRYF